MNLVRYIDYCVFWLICYVLVFDSVTGYFLNKDIHLPVSQIMKFLLLAMLIVRVMLFNKARFAALIYVQYSLAIIIFFLLAKTERYTDTLVLYSKFLLTVFVFLYFKMLFRTDPQATLQKVDKIMLINLIVLIINIIVFGILGIGFSQYDDAIGSKGFFFAGNELSAVLIIFFAYYIAKSLTLKGIRKWGLNFTLLVLAVYSATKTGMLGFVLLFLLLPGMMRDKSVRKRLETRVVKTILFVVSGIIFCFGMYFFIMQSGIVERWQYFYERNGIAFLIFSGRIEYITEQIRPYNMASQWHRFFGLGGSRTVEMDFFDVLLNFGYLGVLLVYCFYFYILLSAYIRRGSNNYPFARWGLLLFGLLLFVSTLAGHTLFSAMAGVFIGIAGALIFYSNKTGHEQA